MITIRKYLINEIQRFYDINDIVPVSKDMKEYNGYPCIIDFYKEFGSWNNAVEAAGFKAKCKRHTGSEVCIVCKTTKTSCWFNSDKGRICKSCYQKKYNKQKRDYMNGLLDIDSNTGFGFLCQRIVANKLGLEIRCDCNLTKGFQHSGYDLLQLDNEKYGRIQVKGSTLRVNDFGSLFWYFSLGDKCNNYIMLGFNRERNDIMKVWIVPSYKSIVINRTALTVILNPKRIRRVAREIVKYEVDAKPYNDVYHSMKKLKECDIFTRKIKNFDKVCIISRLTDAEILALKQFTIDEDDNISFVRIKDDMNNTNLVSRIKNILYSGD